MDYWAEAWTCQSQSINWKSCLSRFRPCQKRFEHFINSKDAPVASSLRPLNVTGAALAQVKENELEISSLRRELRDVKV